MAVVKCTAEEIGKEIDAFFRPMLDKVAEKYGRENCSSLDFHNGMVLVAWVGWVSMNTQEVVIPMMSEEEFDKKLKEFHE